MYNRLSMLTRAALSTSSHSAGEPRRATVTYTCRPGNIEQVMSVTESAVCVYDITVVTGLLCPKAENALPSPKALCYPLSDDGTPVGKPPQELDLDGGGVEALSALSLAGSQWTGMYDCQGEQWFRLRVHKQWVWDPATLAEQYRHSSTCEVYVTRTHFSPHWHSKMSLKTRSRTQTEPTPQFPSIRRPPGSLRYFNAGMHSYMLTVTIYIYDFSFIISSL